MLERLSTKQEAFCLAFIRLNDQSAAYREVYDHSRMKPKTINEKASRLMAISKVRARVDELRNEIKNSAIAEAKELQEFWSAILRDKKLDVPYRLKASELQGKAKGVFIERKELTGKDGKDLVGINQPAIDYNKLSDSALEEIANARINNDECKS